MEELNYLGNKNMELETFYNEHQGILEELQELREEHEVLLTLLGEKSEEVESLLEDMKEVKYLYRNELDTLLEKVADPSVQATVEGEEVERQ